MASPIQWTRTWANSGRWWGTGKLGVLQSMGSQRGRHDLSTGQQWGLLKTKIYGLYSNPKAQGFLRFQAKLDSVRQAGWQDLVSLPPSVSSTWSHLLLSQAGSPLGISVRPPLRSGSTCFFSGPMERKSTLLETSRRGGCCDWPNLSQVTIPEPITTTTGWAVVTGLNQSGPMWSWDGVYPVQLWAGDQGVLSGRRQGTGC